MSAFLGIGLKLYEWSNCSASELRHYRIAGGTKCLMETDPANAIIKPSFPGQEFNLTYQCKAMFGDHAVVCPRQPNSVSSSCFVTVGMHINYMHTAIVALKHGGCVYYTYIYVYLVDGGRMA